MSFSVCKQIMNVGFKGLLSALTSFLFVVEFLEFRIHIKLAHTCQAHHNTAQRETTATL